MFHDTLHNKAEREYPEPKSQPEVKAIESSERSMITCPDILTGISREIRTQMNAIVAFSYLLDRGEHIEPEKKDLSDHIYYSCERIITLFDNFLDSAIIDTGNSSSESKYCHPDQIFNGLFSEFRETLRTGRYGDILFIQEPPACRKADCLIDAGRITRVARNLFNNALCNIKSGFIKAGYYVRNDALVFNIMDTGGGYLKDKEFLHTKDLAISLKKFNDIYSAVNLTLTRKLVQIQGGVLTAARNGKAGSRISFSIPIGTGNSLNITNKFVNTINTI